MRILIDTWDDNNDNTDNDNNNNVKDYDKNIHDASGDDTISDNDNNDHDDKTVYFGGFPLSFAVASKSITYRGPA